MMNRYFNPDTMAAPLAVYSNGVEVPPGVHTVFVAGQVGMDADGKTPEDFAAEADLAFGNIVKVLADAGLAPTDIVKLNTYMTRPDDVAALREGVTRPQPCSRISAMSFHTFWSASRPSLTVKRSM